MKIDNLREAQLYFENQIPSVNNRLLGLHKTRREIIQVFNPVFIKSMPLDVYAAGTHKTHEGFNFCNALEQNLDGLGKIIGATASKFGVYYGRTKKDPTIKYRFAKKFGPNYNKAFINIKNSISELLEAGKNGNTNKIIENKLSPMFKGKILATYYPNRYLNIFSGKYLDHYITQLNLDITNLGQLDPVVKREKLLEFKNADKVMKSWSIDLFSYFLHAVYPGKPLKEKDNGKKDPLADYRAPEFPVDPEPEFIDLKISLPVIPAPERKTSKHSGGNPDYVSEARKNKKLGDRGEHIVFELEKKLLIENGRNNLAEKVKKAKYDYEGYDIRSFDMDGSPKYIEVKATKAKVGQAYFFLSSNELNKSKELKNYWIYMVYDILSKKPKIWRIPNPFNPENKKVIKTPVSYRVQINVSH